MSAAAAARMATSTVDRRIGYVASGMGARTPEEIVELLARAGYAAVDWTMEQYDPLDAPLGRLREIAELARASGLEVAQLMVHQDHVALDEREWERRVRRAECAVLACAHAEIDSIGVLTGPNPWERGAARIGLDVSEAQAWELSLRALERVLRRAEEECVRVALEPCWGTLAHGRYRAEHALAALDCAALAVNFDPSHHVLCGDDVAGAVRAWGGRIAHVHLKDAFGFSDPAARARGFVYASRAHARGGVENEQPPPDADFTFLLPGEGVVPWAEMFDALDAIGYTGAMSVENEAYRLLAGPLRGDLARGAELARELVAGLLDGRAATRANAAA